MLCFVLFGFVFCFVLCCVLFCFVFCFVLFCVCFVLFCFVFVLFCFVLFCFVFVFVLCFVLFCFGPVLLLGCANHFKRCPDAYGPSVPLNLGGNCSQNIRGNWCQCVQGREESWNQPSILGFGKTHVSLSLSCFFSSCTSLWPMWNKLCSALVWVTQSWWIISLWFKNVKISQRATLFQQATPTSWTASFFCLYFVYYFPLHLVNHC